MGISGCAERWEFQANMQKKVDLEPAKDIMPGE